jgi:hypothetical protein
MKELKTAEKRLRRAQAKVSKLDRQRIFTEQRLRILSDKLGLAMFDLRQAELSLYDLRQPNATQEAPDVNN